MVLWSQLKELEKCCAVRIQSHLRKDTGSLSWSIAIIPNDGRHSPILYELPDLTEAVRAGVDQARKIGLLRD